MRQQGLTGMAIRVLLATVGVAGASRVSSVSSAAAPAVLEGGGLRAAFDARGALLSLRRAEGDELLAAAADSVALRFGIGVPSEQGTPRLLEFGTDRAGSVQVERLPAGPAGEMSLRVRFADFAVDGAPAELSRLTAWLSATLTPGQEGLSLRVGAEAPEPLIIEYIQGPAVPVAIGADSRLVTGVAKGGVYPDLTEWKEGALVSAAHPGNLAAQFGAVYGPLAGVVSHSRDTAGYPKGLLVRRAGPAVSLLWRHAAFVTGRYEPPYDVLVRPLAADPAAPLTWRHAADTYAEWARCQAWCGVRFQDRTDIPAWLKTGPSLVRFHRDSLARPESIGRWLREYWQALHGKEIPLIVAFWGWEHVESWVSPTYLPPFPGAAEFEQVMAEVVAANGHGFLWPSGYHWTVTFGAREDGTFQWDDRARWEAEGKAHTVVNRDGSLAVSPRSWLRGGQNATLCPGDPWTRDWFDRIGLDCLSTGADMVQIDQVVCGNFPSCFSPDHGHPPGPGLWKAEVFAAQMRSLAAVCRAVRPEAVVGFEEPQELFNGLAGIQDYRDLETAWGNLPAPELASVFAYLYHEFLPVFQSNPRGGDLVAQGYCLVNGQIPHLRPSTRIGRGPLVLNGGFDEAAKQGDVPAGWDKVGGYKGEVWNGACALDTETVRSGRASLRLDNAGELTVQVSQNVPIGKGGLVPGVPYRMRAWLRSERLARPNAINFAALTHALEGKGGNGRLPFPEPDGQWHEVSAAFTVPAEASFLRMMIHVSGDARVWVDDLAIVDEASGQVVEVDATPPDHDLTRQWSRLFHGEGRPYLLHGRMLHPPVLETERVLYRNRELPVILHNAFRAADGSAAVVLVNVTNLERTGVLHWQGQAQTIALAAQEVRLLR
jgi:hypothetical protein